MDGREQRGPLIAATVRIGHSAAQLGQTLQPLRTSLAHFGQTGALEG
jgi:hypothetical protein